MEIFIYYALGQLGILGLMFLGGYVLGTNKEYRHQANFILRDCDHEFVNLSGLGVCVKCGHLQYPFISKETV